jgi:tRNA (guanine-N7-)-methyltransferase
MPSSAHSEEEERGVRQRPNLYGRRKGPKLSAHQAGLFDTLLPLHRWDSSQELAGEVWLEIGFGAGEHLLWQAQHHPAVTLIGAEPYEGGVAKLLSRISLSPTEGEGRGEGVATRTESSDDASPPPHPGLLPPWGRRGNIKIHMGDARDILAALPGASLGRVFVLFPDPWPKTRHHKRRFLQTEMLDTLARLMTPGAELRFASDDAPLVEYTLERLMAHPDFTWTAARAEDWKTRPAGWPPTRYEAKQLHGVPAFLRFVRNPATL